MRAHIIVSIFFKRGCSIKEVKPWEKGTLAKDILKPNMGNSLYTKLQTIYTSQKRHQRVVVGFPGGVVDATKTLFSNMFTLGTKLFGG